MFSSLVAHGLAETNPAGTVEQGDSQLWLPKSGTKMGGRWYPRQVTGRTTLAEEEAYWESPDGLATTFDARRGEYHVTTSFATDFAPGTDVLEVVSWSLREVDIWRAIWAGERDADLIDPAAAKVVAWQAANPGGVFGLCIEHEMSDHGVPRAPDSPTVTALDSTGTIANGTTVGARVAFRSGGAEQYPDAWDNAVAESIVTPLVSATVNTPSDTVTASVPVVPLSKGTETYRFYFTFDGGATYPRYIDRLASTAVGGVVTATLTSTTGGTANALVPTRPFLSYTTGPGGTSTGPAGGSDDFVRCWRHIYDRFEAQGVAVDRIVWVPVYMGWDFRSGVAVNYNPWSWWPGYVSGRTVAGVADTTAMSKYVSTTPRGRPVCGLDPYSFRSTQPISVASPQLNPGWWTVSEFVSANFPDATREPQVDADLAICETGVGYDNPAESPGGTNRRPQFWRDLPAELASNTRTAGRIALFLYWMGRNDNSIFDVKWKPRVDAPGGTETRSATHYGAYLNGQAYTTGWLVQPNNGYTYEAKTTGVTRTTGAPTWPTVVGAQVADGSDGTITWECIGIRPQVNTDTDSRDAMRDVVKTASWRPVRAKMARHVKLLTPSLGSDGADRTKTLELGIPAGDMVEVIVVSNRFDAGTQPSPQASTASSATTPTLAWTRSGSPISGVSVPLVHRFENRARPAGIWRFAAVLPPGVPLLKDDVLTVGNLGGAGTTNVNSVAVFVAWHQGVGRVTLPPDVTDVGATLAPQSNVLAVPRRSLLMGVYLTGGTGTGALPSPTDGATLLYAAAVRVGSNRNVTIMSRVAENGSTRVKASLTSGSATVASVSSVAYEARVRGRS